MLLAVISSIIFQFLLVYCLVLFTNLSTDYVHWLWNTWTTVTSLRMWTYLLILTAVTCLQGVFCSKIYLYSPPYYKSRFSKLCATLTVQNLCLKASYIIMGGILVWLHLSLKGGTYSSLTTDCNIVYGTCLVEEYYFLLFSGLWSGLYFSIKIDSMKYFRFSIIAQSKFLRLRQGIYAMLPKLMVSSTWSTLYYMAVYYFLGSYCRRVLLSLISIQTEVEPLDNMSRLLNLTLILQLWLHQFIFILTVSSTYLLFEIYLTEWIPFKFGSSGAYSTDASELTLIDALSMDKIPIMQHLGYLDLVTLAQKEKMRRGMLFTLSQPGGHPYNWNCIVQKCIDVLKKFSYDFNAISIKPQEQQFYYSTNVCTARIAPVQPVQKDYIYHMRKLVPDVTPTLPTETDTQEAPYSGMFIQKFIKQKREAFIAYLLSKPLINYIFGEQDDNKIRYLLLNGQVVIWAAEAISSLSVFSLSEDSYGVVQKDVPNIINTLLSVKQVLDKLQKSAVLTRKFQADDKLIKEIFISLKSAIKRSLYRIVTNFEPYINDLTLESLTIEQLQSFLNYRE